MDDLFDSLKNIIESERLAGVEEIFLSASAVKREKITLEKMQEMVLDCHKCPLADTRNNAVFGEGNPKADLMFVGEAPGGDEDKQGRPFVGRAGQLLTKIIESIGLKRDDVYIANILKCRPPGNRNPMPSEIAGCLPYLQKQIELIEPKVICALGKFAAQTLLNTETPISRLRGTFYDYRGTKLMPTYHPAYLLRNPGGKKEVWQDMKKVAAELGLKIPAKRK
ncbi:MAG: uracil-DNA glycosylase [Candidatus Omnitrophota bacterium]|jgi:DNA polymerase